MIPPIKQLTQAQTMKVAILGSGDVAKVLPGGFLKHGHEVMLGTREATKLAEWSRDKPNARIGGLADAASFGELAVLAVKGSAAAAALRAAAPNLAGKTVIDTTSRYRTCRLASRLRRPSNGRKREQDQANSIELMAWAQR
jgi:predicted dinucleotide-binding enzyme